MKRNRGMARVVAPMFLMAGILAMPLALRAGEDSEHINKLLADTRAEAAELKLDAEDLKTYSDSALSWESHAVKIEMMKEHINKTGKLVASLKEAEATGSEWQQSVVRRVEPLLRELAATTRDTILFLNDNQSKVHLPAFKDRVKANYELAVDLSALVRDFVNYGDARKTMERLGIKLEVS